MGFAAAVQTNAKQGDSSRLASLVRAFAEPNGSADTKTRPDLLRLLSTIDRTILPRALMLTAEDGTCVRLLISNRRLMRVDLPEGSTDTPSDPAEAARSFAARLFPLFRDGQTVSIVTERYHSDALFWDVGCSAGRLAAELQVDDQDPPAPELEDESFSAAIEARAEAWAFVTEAGRIEARSDTPETEAVLDRLLAKAVPSRQEAAKAVLQAPSAGPDCSVVALDGTRDILIARDGQGTHVALVARAQSGALQKSWRAGHPV